MADEKVRVLLRGGSHDGLELELTRDQRLVTKTIHPDAYEVYVPGGDVEDRDGAQVDVYRLDPDQSVGTSRTPPSA
jgi:hypothetical protein